MMISDGFTFISVLLTIAACLKAAETYWQTKLFQYLPSFVMLYFVVMILSGLQVWDNHSASLSIWRKQTTTIILPAMIFLMLIKCDLRLIARLGSKMLIGFFCAACTIAIGFIISFTLFHHWLAADAWKSYGALAGSWMGGTGNMVAIKEALHAPQNTMNYMLLTDSANYTLWVMILLFMTSYAAKFNCWTQANTALLANTGHQLRAKIAKQRQQITLTDLLILIAMAFFVSTLTTHMAAFLPTGHFFSTTTWTILLTTLLGLIAALSPLARLPGSSELANIMLYLLIALVGSQANFSGLIQAPLYVLSGSVVIFVHAVLMILCAKLFRLSLFTCGVASLANIGGVAAAPVLAAAYSEDLIPVGVLMALLGYAVGTEGGLIVAKILSLI